MKDLTRCLIVGKGKIVKELTRCLIVGKGKIVKELTRCLIVGKGKINCRYHPLHVFVRLAKLTTEHVLGTMVVPYWPSADNWPLLKQGEKWESYVVDLEIFENGKSWLHQGRGPMSLLGSEIFTGAMVAFRINSER